MKKTTQEKPKKLITQNNLTKIIELIIFIAVITLLITAGNEIQESKIQCQKLVDEQACNICTTQMQNLIMEDTTWTNKTSTP